MRNELENETSVDRELGNFGDLPAKFESSKEELETMIREYTNLLSQRKSLEAMIPRAFKEEDDLTSLVTNLDYTKNNDLDTLTKALSAPIWDLLDRGGKKWRPTLSLLIAQAYDANTDDLLTAASLVEIVHNGSLVIDDIQDQSQLRRGKPCIHLTYGVDVSINAGCFMFFAPALALIKSYEATLPKEKVFNLIKIYIEEMVNIHFGQGWDIYWHNSDKIEDLPYADQYLQMSAHKTGVLARLSARLTCEIIGLSEDVQKRFADFSERIGVAFQIQDDILNLTSQNYVATKGYYGEDIFEGKKTLMMIHCLTHATPEDQSRLLEILKMKTKEMNLIDQAINIVEKTGSIDYAKQRAEELIKEAWDGIKDYIPNNKFKGYLKALAEFFVTRNV